MLRVPVAGRYAWRHYGVDWVGLDPPRHIAVPTPEGLDTLAAAEGYDLYDSFFDSSAIQFWRSEQYQQGIPLIDPRSHQVDQDASPFTPAEIADWERRSRELNAQRDGDTAAFFLRPVPRPAASA